MNVSTDLPLAPSLRAFAGGRYLLVLACVAVACGGLGAGFTFVLRGVERLAFGFTTGTLAEAITGVDALHRFLAVAIGGVRPWSMSTRLPTSRATCTDTSRFI